MTSRDRKRWATSKSNVRRQVFAQFCACRKPSVQSAVMFGQFCTACFHPLAPAKAAVRRRAVRKNR